MTIAEFNFSPNGCHSCVSRNPELLNIGISKIVSKSGFGIKMKINIKIKKIEDLN